jgi:hypothetical protein
MAGLHDAIAAALADADLHDPDEPPLTEARRLQDCLRERGGIVLPTTPDRTYVSVPEGEQVASWPIHIGDLELTTIAGVVQVIEQAGINAETKARIVAYLAGRYEASS